MSCTRSNSLSHSWTTLSSSDRSGEPMPVGQAAPPFFERGPGRLTREDKLAHVADIEQAGMSPGPEVFGDDAFKLHGHPVAGEFDHPPPARTVPGIER